VLLGRSTVTAATGWRGAAQIVLTSARRFGLLLRAARRLHKSLHTAEQKILREMLIAARRKAGLRQHQLAGGLGRPQPFIAKHEGGERRLDVIELIAIANPVGLDPLRLAAAIGVGGLAGRQRADHEVLGLGQNKPQDCAALARLRCRTERLWGAKTENAMDAIIAEPAIKACPS
jgi:hypothetical protein